MSIIKEQRADIPVEIIKKKQKLIAIQKLIRNLFLVNVTNVSDDIQKEIIELQYDSNCKNTIAKLEKFWSQKQFLF